MATLVIVVVTGRPFGARPPQAPFSASSIADHGLQ